MDPKETLRLADQHISDGEYSQAIEALGDFWHWRQHGGYRVLFAADETILGEHNGDALAVKLAYRLSDALRAFSS